MMDGQSSFGGGRLSAALALTALVSVAFVGAFRNVGLRNSLPPAASAQAIAPIRRVNAPYFAGEVRFSETAIFWFGEVDSSSNYADVRVGYNDDELRVRLAAFDRWLWYDTTPSADDLTAWDAITLYLDLHGNEGGTPDANSYRFVGQLNWWEEREPFQTAYRGDGSGWVSATIPFTTTAAWRGTSPNDNREDDRGWALTFHVPFEALGLSDPPQGSVWRLGAVLHDRDDEAGTPIADKTWPEVLDPGLSSTWGQLTFGLPEYAPPLVAASGTVTVQHKLDGAVVTDAAVGGTTGNLCPGDADYIWNKWGDDNFVGDGAFNVQNQSDVADWPCFAKYYVTFPLDKVPPGQAIVYATLELHQFGNSGGGAWGEPEPSFIQVLTVAESWEETALTWNSAPLATENVAAAWVDPVMSFPGWPGLAREWDVSLAVAEAHAAREPMRLVLYEADSAYHSGKYFVSSDTGDWNAEGRPKLTVVYGEPVGTVDKYVHPVTANSGEIITYKMVVLGSGYPLTLTDTLPDGLSDPGPIQVSYGSAAYHPASRRVEWNGTPAIGQRVTVAFSTTVQVSGPVALVNTAALTDTLVGPDTDIAVVFVDGFPIYLPLAVR